jgi:hypothetical protein
LVGRESVVTSGEIVPMAGGMTSFLLPPTFMPATPLSQPLMTSPTPEEIPSRHPNERLVRQDANGTGNNSALARMQQEGGSTETEGEGLVEGRVERLAVREEALVEDADLEGDEDRAEDDDAAMSLLSSALL